MKAKRHSLAPTVPHDYSWQSDAVGPNYNYKTLRNQGTYMTGHKVYSPAYVGYKYNGMNYRIGVDRPHVQDNIQNRLHRAIGSPYFRTDYAARSIPYFFMRTYDPFSHY